MSERRICARCGKQNLFDELDDNCLFCGEPLSNLEIKKEVTMPTPAGTKESKIPRRPKRKRLVKKYFEENKEAMLNDYYSLTLKEFLARWHIASTTWGKLKKEWNVATKNVRRLGVPIHGDPRETHKGLIEHEKYLILLGYQEAVRDILAAIK